MAVSIPIDYNTSGAHTLVSGIAGRKIRVIGYFLASAGTLTVQFTDSIPTNLTGVMSITSGQMHSPGAFGHGDLDKHWWFETSPGADLIINYSASVQCGGYLHYERTM